MFLAALTTEQSQTSAMPNSPALFNVRVIVLKVIKIDRRSSQLSLWCVNLPYEYDWISAVLI